MTESTGRQRSRRRRRPWCLWSAGRRKHLAVRGVLGRKSRYRASVPGTASTALVGGCLPPANHETVGTLATEENTCHSPSIPLLHPVHHPTTVGRGGQEVSPRFRSSGETGQRGQTRSGVPPSPRNHTCCRKPAGVQRSGCTRNPEPSVTPGHRSAHQIPHARIGSSTTSPLSTSVDVQ